MEWTQSLVEEAWVWCWVVMSVGWWRVVGRSLGACGMVGSEVWWKSGTAWNGEGHQWWNGVVGRWCGAVGIAFCGCPVGVDGWVLRASAGHRSTCGEGRGSCPWWKNSGLGCPASEMAGGLLEVPRSGVHG